MKQSPHRKQSSCYANKHEKERHNRQLSSARDIDGVTYRLAMYKGTPVAPFPGVAARLTEFESNFRPRESDVWICGFVKTGTHWVNEIAHMIVRQTHSPSALKEDFMVERVDCQKLEQLASPRVLNTHLLPHQLPTDFPASGRLLLLTRDVRDVAVSLYHHCSSREPDNLALYQTSWPAFLDTFCKGLSQNGGWFEYAKAWRIRVQRMPEQRRLLLRYEEALENPRQTVETLAKFLLNEEELQRVTPEFIDGVVEATSFKKMKEVHQHDTFVPMYRKGVSGDWKNWFSDLDVFNMKAEIFDCLNDEDKKIFKEVSGVTDWN